MKLQTLAMLFVLGLTANAQIGTAHKASRVVSDLRLSGASCSAWINTVCFRTVEKNDTVNMHYVADPANGDSITILNGGIYAISLSLDKGVTSRGGITVNGDPLVGVTYQPLENILCMVGSGSGSEFLSCSATAILSAGDVIRAQTEYLAYGFAKLIMVKLN
jgi:hypothetical protein